MTEGLSEEFYDRWEHLLADIEMNEVPLKFVREIAVNMIEGDVVLFDVASMLAKKLSCSDIEDAVEQFLLENDDAVEKIDFHIDIKAVATEVTHRTSKILGK